MERLFFPEEKKALGVMVTERFITNTSVHWHDFYELEMFLSGRGITVINGQSYTFSTGDISFLTPSDFHNLLPEEDVMVLNITFPAASIMMADDAEPIPSLPTIHLHPEQTVFVRMRDMVLDIRRELEANAPLSALYVRHLLSCLRIELVRLGVSAYEAGQVSAAKDAIPAAIAFLHAHLREPITIANVASAVGFSSGYLGKLFKARMGCSFSAFLTGLRLDCARQLLRYTDRSVTEIAYSCGWNSIGHFLRVFKAAEGVSPRTYRLAEQGILDKQ